MTEGPGGQGFEPATGDEIRAESAAGGPGESGADSARAAELRTAYEGMLQIRRLVNGSGVASVPAPWEVRRMPRAVALALEAAGIAASAVDERGRRIRTGYRVAAGAEAGRVEVTWLGPAGGGAAEEEQERLTACAAVLEALGWVCLLYRGPRRRRFLEVEPPRRT
ncbi:MULTISPECIES: hypothetical protein [unclassified Streptomyces]|uniref:hypothetical protein n=1 Tax=unclassified Streptomyces TaxID=2593676 RepID=UPI003B641E6B